MKAFAVLLFASIASYSQTPPQPALPPFPNVPDDQVICTFDDGVAMTAREFKIIFSILPPEQQKAVMDDRAGFVKQWGVMRKLTRLAEQNKLDEQSPTREKAEYYRMMTLMEAEMLHANAQVVVSPAEAKAYYDAHRDKYEDVLVKAIYIGFSADGKPRTEEEAKALAARLKADLRGGADFVKLVAQYSEEPTSKAKNGDFGTFHGSDNIPEATRAMVMALKPGEVSEPVRQPNGIYLFRAESVSYKSFDQIKDEILEQLRKDRYTQWFDKLNQDTKVDIKSPVFFGLPGPASAAGKPSGAH